MSDAPAARDFGDLTVEMPAHARLEGMEFRDSSRELRVLFSDGGERVVPADQIASLRGAHVRHQHVSLTVTPSGSQSVGDAALTWLPLGMGIPRSLRTFLSSESFEELSRVFALRATGIEELWYLVADSFDFRKTLGPDAGYSTEINLRALVRRLAAFAPQAMQDRFCAALLGKLPFPPPMNSLFEFFRVAVE